MGRWRSRPVSRVLSWTVIPLGATSPLRSSSLPGPDAGDVMGSLFGLAPGGVCRAGLLPGSRCALTAPFHPCHAFRRTVRRYLSVALSVGSRRPGVTWHRALWSPDFPRHSRRSDATVWPTPPWAFYGFGDEYPRIRLRGCRTGSLPDPSSASLRQSGKAEHRAFGGPPCPGGGAHPSGRHPVFTRVVAHPCATCAPPPGHGVLGGRQGRSFSPLREPGSRRGMKRHDRSRDLEAPEDVAGRGGLREWPWMATPASRHRDVPSRRPQSPSGRRGSLRSQPRIAVALVVAVPVAVRLAVKRDRQRLSRPRRHPHHRAPCAARR